jgi:hypothetical protein
MAFKIQRFIPASPITMPDPDPKDPKPSNVKYGDMKKSSTTDQSGRTTVTVTQPFSTPGSSKTGKSYKQFAAEGGNVEEAKRFNAGKSGSRTTTYSYGGTKSASMKPFSANTPKIDLSKKPTLKKLTKRQEILLSQVRRQDEFDKAHGSTAEQRRKSHNSKKKKKNLFKVKSNLRKRVSRGSNFKPGCF